MHIISGAQGKGSTKENLAKNTEESEKVRLIESDASNWSKLRLGVHIISGAQGKGSTKENLARNNEENEVKLMESDTSNWSRLRLAVYIISCRMK